MAPTQTTFPATITASTWASAWGAAFDRAQTRYGRQSAPDGTLAPAMTSADLASLTRAWRTAAGASRFPLWSQWGAFAYAWDPSTPARFDTSAARSRARVAPDVSEDFWRSTRLLALSLDDDKRTVRLDIDASTFADPVWLAMVRADLASDGAKVEWSIPVGCRDPITGKARLPHLGCPKGWKLVEVSPGAFMCRQTSTGRMSAPTRVCDGAPVVVRDPITDVKDSIIKGALILGFLWLVSRRSVGNR